MEKRSLESCTILLLTGNHTATKGFIFWSGMFSHAVHPHGFAKHRFDDLITTICFQYSSATEWVKLFLTLKDKEVGYAKGNITPYIHVLVYHVPRFFKILVLKSLQVRELRKQMMLFAPFITINVISMMVAKTLLWH